MVPMVGQLFTYADGVVVGYYHEWGLLLLDRWDVGWEVGRRGRLIGQLEICIGMGWLLSFTYGPSGVVVR